MNPEMVTICMDCKRVLDAHGNAVPGSEITEAPETLGVVVSHGLCKEHYAKRQAELAEYRKQRGKT